MEALKRFKKGEILFRENTPITHIYVVQQGKVALQVDRGGKRLEVATTVVGQLLGEQGLFSSARHAFTAEAMQETKVMEVPLELMKSQVQAASAGVKVLLKSMVDELKSIRQSFKAMRMEQDKVACPQPSIPRVFSILNLVTRHTGKKNEDTGIWQCDWTTLKLYTMRMFAESPVRMRSLMDLLKKIQWAELEVETSEEGEEEIKKINLYDLQRVEDFAEFYQHNLYKGGYSEVIHVDSLALRVARALSQIAEGIEVDRRGAVLLPYNQAVQQIKDKFNFELKSTHLEILEKKGLFVKRQSLDDGTVNLSFDKVEFDRIPRFWQVILEIDKWNDRGFVDLNEKEEVKAVGGESTCPQCSGAVDTSHKFCPHCGFKIQVAA